MRRKTPPDDSQLTGEEREDLRRIIRGYRALGWVWTVIITVAVSGVAIAELFIKVKEAAQ